MHGKDKSSKQASEARVVAKLEGYSYPDLSPADIQSLRDESGYGTVADEPSRRTQAIVRLRIRALRKWHEENDQIREPEPWELPVHKSKPWDFLRDEKMGVVD